MGESTQAITIKSREIDYSVDVRAWLLRLHFRRKFLQAGSRVMLALACTLALCVVVALLDYLWPIKRVWRIAFVSSLWLAAVLAVAHAVWSLIKKRTLVEVAREIERAGNSKQNALVTFAEHAQEQMPTDGGAALVAASTHRNNFDQSYVFARLRRQVQSELAGMNRILVLPRRTFQRRAALLVCALLLLFALRLAAPFAFARETKRVLLFEHDDDASIGKFDKESKAAAMNNTNDPNAVVVIDDFRVRVLPPSYSGLGAQDVSNSDAPVRALKGSQIEVTMHTRGTIDKALISFGGATNAMRALQANRFTGTFNAAASGAFETRVVTFDERRAPAPIVRAVEVYADAPPEARIIEPATDQLLRAVPDRPVAVRWTARDDLGLQNVALRFIKSRGEGDAAKFTNGETSPGQTTRLSAREWRGQTALDLARLDMQAGDTLVFWIEARDRNSFANNTGRSASLSIAIKGAEVFKLDLSDLRPSEVGRFLLSERLILLHTEKLHNERARLAQTEFTRRANIIAAEQREFKNSFKDYINIEGAAGEEAHSDDATTAAAGQALTVEQRAQAAADERTEIHNHGIPEPPPGAPASVTEMTLAISAMWNAEDALSASDTTKALMFEREALARLKLAQAAVRYVPPVLPRSKPLDLKRRYAGELAEIRTQLENLARRPATKEAAPVRAALADAFNALAELQSTLGVPTVGRSSAVARARDKSRAAANRLVSLGGDHAATIAEAAGQLRIVETELQHVGTSGTSEDFAARLSKPLTLLAQAASNLYAIAEQSVHGSGDSSAGTLAPSDDARANEYFRRLTRRAMR